MVALFISLIAAGGFYYWENLFKNKWVNILILIVLSLVIVGFDSKYFVAQKYLQVSENSFTNAYFLKFRTSQLSSEYMPKDFAKPKVYSQVPAGVNVTQGKATVLAQNKKTGEYTITYAAATNAKMIVPIAYFPAWKVNLDGKNYGYSIVSNGLSVNLPEGEHLLDFYFRDTNIELLSNVLSLSGILLLIIGIILKKKLL